MTNREQSHRFTFLLILLISAFVLVASKQSAYAQTAKLMLDDGINPVVTILDNSSMDTDPRLGVVGYSGGIGVFNLNILTGITQPFLPGLPQIDLFDVTASTFTAPGSIDIWFSDIGFTGIGSPGLVTTTVGGTTDDTVEFFSFLDVNNQLFGGTQTGNLGPYIDAYDPPSDPPLGFSGTTYSTLPISSTPFSLTGKATITHSRAGDLTSFDLNVKVAPEPVSSTLFIVGGATLGFRRLWRKKKIS